MTEPFKLISLHTRMATEDDAHLETYDHTKLSNINTCPTWGILRYSLHKKMPSSYRQMALEAGGAAHESFAAVRWMQLFKDHPSLAMYHGPKLFTADRFRDMYSTISSGATDRTNLINFALEALYSSGFYDDPSDRNRSVSNISESLIAYIDAYDMKRYPLWIRDSFSVESDVGIEIAFDIVISLEYELHGTFNKKEVRFTGKLDGLHLNKKGELIIIEEKTGARLDDAWLSQWILSHQITGYCLAASTFTDMPCNAAMVSGMRIPIGKHPHEGIRKELVPRSHYMLEKWATWFVTTIEIEETWRDQIINAPMYTHSCNRYFSSCSFLALCAADTLEEKQLILAEMVDDEWSPLND